MTGKLLLIDGHSIINRAFYGLPDLTNAEGKHTGAVLGKLEQEKAVCWSSLRFPMYSTTMAIVL